jgi:hypothetical protein
MRMSRERIFHLADLIMKELGTTHGVHVKAPDDVRPEIIRVLTEESNYSRPMPEGSREWEVLYQKTREEVYKRRFRL